MEIPGENLLIKLWESLANNGVGGLLKPWQIRREGRANTEVKCSELVLLAQAERQADAIRRGDAQLINGMLVPVNSRITHSASGNEKPETPESIINSALNQSIANTQSEQIKQEISVAKAIIYAEESLINGEEPCINEEVRGVEQQANDDWIHRWKELASKATTEDLQKLWGKVLANETKTPGKYSFRTLEFLKNISHQEAKTIEKLAPFVANEFIIVEVKDGLKGEGLHFADLLLLTELGLITDVQGFGLSYTIASSRQDLFENIIICNNRLIVASAPTPHMSIKLTVYLLTGLGKQVLALGDFSANEKMVRLLGSMIKNQGFSVQIGSYMRAGKNQYYPMNMESI